MSLTQNQIDLSVTIGRLRLPNPILVASGTFGYAREMAGFVELSKLGGIVPKTITREPRIGNAPWRTIETPSGMLNAIGLDNDGIDTFVQKHLPYLTSFPTPLIVSIAGQTHDDFVGMAQQLSQYSSIAALELNISCPNVSHGVDFGTDPAACEKVVAGCRKVCNFPIIAKLTPNVTDIASIARGAENGGADGISVINTVQGMSVDWRRKKAMLGNVVGGLSGPAIKPIALRCVYQVARAVKTPIIGIGGIAMIDDVMEFIITGASAVQLGTANFYDPTVSMRILNELENIVTKFGVANLSEMVGSLEINGKRIKV
jgi:dihydroorotate dehydrogenase (NAD+) catalytic subunit